MDLDRGYKEPMNVLTYRPKLQNLHPADEAAWLQRDLSILESEGLDGTPAHRRTVKLLNKTLRKLGNLSAKRAIVNQCKQNT